MKKMIHKPKRTSRTAQWVMTTDDQIVLAKLQSKFGIDRTQVLRIAIRKLAELEQVA